MFALLPGVAEIYGMPGCGRTHACLLLSRGRRTLWVSKYAPFPSHRALSLAVDLQQLILGKARTLAVLMLALKSGRLKDYVLENRVELVVVNRLSDYHLMYKLKIRHLVDLVVQLKRLFMETGTKSVLINDGLDIRRHFMRRCVSSLGHSFPWLYAIGTRFFIQKDGFTESISISMDLPVIDREIRYIATGSSDFVQDEDGSSEISSEKEEPL